MRAGGACSLQQALTPEATAVVKHAVTLARRRGHAQVTPLHVANTMLSSSHGLLRAACLRSNSHPFQCRALELCFNVALNRLPAATPTTAFSLHGPDSQYHHHQVPAISNALIAAFKRAQAHQRRGSIENNQTLVAVKIELDQLVISILDDPSVSRVMREAGFSSSQVKNNVEKVAASTHPPPPLLISDHSPDKDPKAALSVQSDDDHVMHVVDSFAEKTRHCITVVGDSPDTTAVVTSVMEKLTTVSDDVLKTLKFINFCLSSFQHLSGDEARRKIEALTVQLTGNGEEDGVVLLIGDLKWVVDRKHDLGIENAIMEIGRLIHDGNRRLWLLATADLETFMRCKGGDPSLETVWQIHPVSIIPNSEFESQFSTKKLCENGSRPDEMVKCRSSSLPPWVQQCDKFDKKEYVPNQYWNPIWSSTQSQHFHFVDQTLTFPFPSPSPSPSLSSSSGLSREEQNLLSTSMEATVVDLNLAPSLCDLMEIENPNRDNLETLIQELERELPWQKLKAIIPEIAATVLKCRSGTVNDKSDTWLVFQGIDRDGKEKLGRELARVFFGSYSSFVSIRKPDEPSCRLFERFAEEARRDPHRVFLVENSEEVDRGCCLEFKKAKERGKIKNPNFGEEIDLNDAMVIFSIELREETRKGIRVSFDLNVSMDDEVEDDDFGMMFGFVDGTCFF